MKEIVLKLDNISKTYGKIRLLSSLSLIVYKGERVALIGPSGSGKTTLLNIIAKSISIDSGNIHVDGLDSEKYNNRVFSRKVGMIRQTLDLIPQLKVINNVLVGKLSEWSFLKSLLSLVIPQEKETALSALKKVGIEDKAFQKTSNLSGGEQQRVALARLLVQNPEIILADEPVASLDPARAEDVLSLINDIVKEKEKTLITTIHSVEYAKKYFTRVIGLRDGKIVFDLPANELKEDKLKNLYSLEVFRDE